MNVLARSGGVVPRKHPYLVPAQPNSFGARVRQLRMRAGLTQLRLEEASGVNQSTISKWENGEITFPRPELVAALERFFAVPSGSLLDLALAEHQQSSAGQYVAPPGSLVIPSPSPRLRETIDTLLLLDEHELRRINRLATTLAMNRRTRSVAADEGQATSA